MRVEYVGHASRRYSASLRDRLMAVMAPASTTTEELCRLHTAVGEAFAATAALAIRRLGLKGVDLIGSHGQTICHLPPARGGRRSTAGETGTLQIGDAAIIAERIGVPVVSGFRQADMAAGGQGAPLVPWTDYVLYGDAKRTRVVQNIGGISNLTYLPAGGGPEDVIAFDCGPGNMLIDALVSHFTKGKETFDRNGRRAARGRVNDAVHEEMSRHPFLWKEPPKSCGREEFGVSYMHSLLTQFSQKEIKADDWIATATRLTVDALASHVLIANNLAHERRGRAGWDEIILCGGGVRNATITKWYNNQLGPGLRSTDDFGIPSQAKEGVSFAMLAAARMDAVPANLPQVTGARRPVVLGSLTVPV